MRVLPAISPHGSQSGRQLMIAIARSRTSNADYSYCPSSVGGEPARPMTTVVRQLTVAAMAAATRLPLRHAPPPLYPATHPISRSRSRRRSPLPASLKSPYLHRATPFYPRRPAVSSLEAFRTPASVHPLAPPFGRHPKTLNDCGRSACVAYV